MVKQTKFKILDLSDSRGINGFPYITVSVHVTGEHNVFMTVSVDGVLDNVSPIDLLSATKRKIREILFSGQYKEQNLKLINQDYDV